MRKDLAGERAVADIELLHFARVVDAGLGRGVQGYLDVMIHSFPSELRAVTTVTPLAKRAMALRKSV